MKQEKKIIHPLKFVMYSACASIVMIFAGLSSAFIVKRSQGNWISYDVPQIFYYSTAVIIVSSISLLLCKKAFVERQMKRYKIWLLVTTILGFGFILLQYIGFHQLWASGITINRNVSFSFLYVIVGVHAVHVLGGAIGLLVMYLNSFSRKRKNYDPIYIELMNTYWHFVDFLWIYLLIFLMYLA